MIRTLIFLPEAPDGPILWVEDGRRGVLGTNPLPWLPEGQARSFVAVAPPTRTVIHYVALPAVTAAQSAAAARMMAADVVAVPVGDVHVAIGDPVPDTDERPLVIVARSEVEEWLARLAGYGIDPGWLVPLPLLLPCPDAGSVVAAWDDVDLVRGSGIAHAIDRALGDIVVPPAPVERIADDRLMPLLVAAATTPSLNLRQGEFRRRRGWRMPAGSVRRLALLAIAVLLLGLGASWAKVARLGFAADALERQIQTETVAALPRGTRVVDAAAQLREQLAAAGGQRGGFLDATSALFSAMQGAPGARLHSLAHDPDGSMKAGIELGGAGDLEALRAALVAGGFDVVSATLRTGEGVPIADMEMRRK